MKDKIALLAAVIALLGIGWVSRGLLFPCTGPAIAAEPATTNQGEIAMDALVVSLHSLDMCMVTKDHLVRNTGCVGRCLEEYQSTTDLQGLIYDCKLKCEEK